MNKAEGDKVTMPSVDQVLRASELVLDSQGKLREVNRVAGENEVRHAQNNIEAVQQKKTIYC